MPRAENRKRPPNSLGNVPGSGSRLKSGGSSNNTEHQMVQNRKQALLDKMKKVQESKKMSAKASKELEESN